MSNDKRPYFDPTVLERRRAERAVIVAPQTPQAPHTVTLVYNWITQRYEPYLVKKSQERKT